MNRNELYFQKRLALKSTDTPGTIRKLSLVELLGDDPTIMEIGAHEGIDTLQFALLFPKGKIFAIEAHPSHFVNLFNRVKHLKNVFTFCVAISNVDGLAYFHQSSGDSNASGSLLKPSGHLIKHKKVFFQPENKLVIQASTLDAFIKLPGLTRIDLIWIDVQGAEKIALLSGAEILKITRYIYTEVSELPMYEGAVSYAELKRSLSDHGFTVKKEFLPREWSGEGNVLFKNNKFI